MTKRLLALFLVCILAIPIFAVPASASSNTGNMEYDNWVNLRYAVDYLERIDAWMPDIYDYLVILGSWLEVISDQIDAFVNEVFDTFWEDINEWKSAFDSFVSSWNSRITALYNGLFHTQTGYLPKILAQIGQLVSGNSSYQGEAEDFENQVSTESTEFQENMDAIDEWTHPDYEADFDPSVDEITGGEDISPYTQALGLLFETTYIPSMLLFMAFSFSVISFAVFGKR